MNKFIKYAFVFMSGCVSGIGICGVKMIIYAITDEYIREGLSMRIVDKISEILYGDSNSVYKHRDRTINYR